jgi:hypothetical protein
VDREAAVKAADGGAVADADKDAVGQVGCGTAVLTFASAPPAMSLYRMNWERPAAI